MTGPYEGYCVQLLLIFSDSYPTKPPKILIIPNQAIDEQYHNHIFIDEHSRDKNNLHFKKFCFDLLDNDFMNTSDEKTGWNPSYTISTLLLQVQNFIADPDMGDHVPDNYLIKQLMDSMNDFKTKFKIIDENGNIIEKFHTWKDPYPPMYFKPKEEKKEKDKENSDIKLKKNEEENRIQLIKENLTCFMLKVNYIDDPNILLGYPISRKFLRFIKKRRLELYPIPEILTYDGFKAQQSLQPHFLEHYHHILLKSSNNEYYSNWLPIYINETHYIKNKDRILKSIAEISSKEEFEPKQIFEIFPIILNSMIIGLYKGKAALSSAFIKCYFQIILLFKKLCQEFQSDYSAHLNNIFNDIKNNNFSVDKHIIPDIGNIFMILLFNKLEINNDDLKRIYNSLFEDFLSRQMYWMFHSEESKYNMKKKILFESLSLNKSIIEQYENNKNLFMYNLNKFIADLHKKNIYENVIDIISNDKGYLEVVYVGRKSVKKQVEILIKQSFKELFQRCSKEGKDKLKQIISENLNFSDYFNFFLLKENDLYNNKQVHELLKRIEKERREEFIKYSFESQRGNYLLLITFFAQKKIEEKGFLEQLEKNYGVYLDVDNFIKDMNQKISEIKTYKQLFEYIGADFIKEDKYKDKDDLDLIIDSYIKAREKNYLVNKPKTNEKSYIKKKNDKNDISSNNNRNNLNNENRQRNNIRNRINERDLNFHGQIIRNLIARETHRIIQRIRDRENSEEREDRERSRDREINEDNEPSFYSEENERNENNEENGNNEGDENDEDEENECNEINEDSKDL